MKKLIQQTEHYTLYEADFMGYTQTFRQWANNIVEIKFNDNFAKANGFKDLANMLNSDGGMIDGLLSACGEIPEWIYVTENGFAIRNTQSNVSMN